MNLPFAKASTLREATANIEALTGQITQLQTDLGTANGNVTTLTTRAEAAEKALEEKTTAFDKATSDLTEANNKISSLQSDLETANTKITNFGATLKSEATSLANTHLAALGHSPIQSDEQIKDGPGNPTSDNMSETEFWSQYRAQKPSNRSAWYNSNKSKIGR